MLEREQQIIQYLLEQPGPMTEVEIARGTSLPLEEVPVLLEGLLKTGKVVKTRKGRYGPPEKMNLVVGRFQANSKGFGFLVPDRDDVEDVYIAPKDMNGAMHGDMIIVRLSGRATYRDGQRREGEVVRILERANPTIVGLFEVDGDIAYVYPDDRRLPDIILVEKNHWGGAQTGDKVVISVTRWPDKKRSARGRVLYRLGPAGDPGVDILGIMHKHRLPVEFPEKVLSEAAALPPAVREEDMRGRLDLRDELLVTIDGEDAKDIDDAISLKWNEDERCWQLGVHIADVSYYVREGSALDREAFERGTSVYLVDRVVPMLPPAISNGICSLHPNVDRLTLSVFMDIDEHGSVFRYRIQPSVVNSRYRLTYDQVWQVLEQNEAADASVREHMDPELVRMLLEAEKLARVLRQRRMQQGAIDFHLPEAKVILDDKGVPQDVVLREHNFAHQIIEEFMLVTNRTVAREFYLKQIPFIYRIHEEPTQEKIEALDEFLVNFGLRLRHGRQVTPHAFQKVLELVRNRPEEQLISNLMLRSMQQARYHEECLGHFGLAADFYCHFTAPIRRYPDLQIHRIINESLKSGRLSNKRKAHYEKIVPDVAEHTSIRERLAIDAERETMQLKMTEFMLGRIGEQFQAIISGVTSFGLFVQLPNLIEGLVHVSTMTDDYYQYIEKNHALVGERKRKVYRLGDQIEVVLTRVNVEERLLDFSLPSMP